MGGGVVNATCYTAYPSMVRTHAPPLFFQVQGDEHADHGEDLHEGA